MKIEVKLGIGFPTCIKKAIIDVPDWCDEESIWEFIHEWANDYIELEWKHHKAEDNELYRG